MRITTFFLLCLVVTGCSKTEQPGNSTPKLVWKAPLLNGSESFTFNPVFYKDLVIYSVQYARLDRSEKPTVVAFKKATGERVWEWKDAQKVSDAFSASWDYYIYQNIFVFSSGPRVYAIDLDTGKSLWNTQSPESGHGSIVGMDRKIYYVQAKFDKTKQTLCTADISVGIWKPVYKIERDTSIAGAITKMIVNKEGNGKSYLYFIKTFVDLNYTRSENHLIKWDIETDTVIFDKISPVSDAHSLTAIDDKYVYLGGQALIGCDKTTGNWQQSYPLPKLSTSLFGSGKCLAKNYKLFAPSTYPRFICYDVNNGNILWQEDGVSTSSPSRLIYHEGVVYYTSGSDGLLHAIDENGKRLWKFQSPDKKGSSGNFDDAISIDETENRVYVSSYYNAICYETIKK